MKQITQIMIVIVSMILLIILPACGQLEATNDSQHVTEAASKIADFDLPDDFVPQFSVAMSGYTVAAYQGPSGPSHLFLIQSEKEADGSELERVLKELAPGANDPNTRMTVIENRTATVRGQQVNVVISEGMNSDKVSYRQVTVGFQGKSGPAMLVFSEPMDRWSDDTVNTLLASFNKEITFTGDFHFYNSKASDQTYMGWSFHSQMNKRRISWNSLKPLRAQD